MGCWGITALESDNGLDAVRCVRYNLPADGQLDLGEMLERLKKDRWNAPCDVKLGCAHTSPMALAEIVVKYLDGDPGSLDYAYTNNCRNIAKDLIAQCTPEQIASVPPKLLRWVAEKLDFQTAVDLVDKGVRPGDEVAGILRTLTGQHQEWMAERLLEHGMPVEPDNYDALYACVSNQAVGAAKLLLDRGIDLEQYQLWAEHRPKGDGYTETMEELAAYWSELQNSTQPEDSPMKGMNL